MSQQGVGQSIVDDSISYIDIVQAVATRRARASCPYRWSPEAVFL